MNDCKDCRYYKPFELLPNNPALVECTNQKASAYPFVILQREHGWFWMLLLGVCGKRGRWFKAR